MHSARGRPDLIRMKTTRLWALAGVAVFSLLASLGLAQMAGPVKVDPTNPHYFSYRGKPLVLVTSDNTWFTVNAADYDFVKFIDALAANRNNFTRLYPGAHPVTYANQPRIFPWVQEADGRYNLDQWNAAYFARLHAFMRYAQKKDVIVDVCLFNGWGTEEKKTYQERWDWCPLNDANNVQAGVGTRRDVQCTLEEPALVEYQKAYVRNQRNQFNRPARSLRCHRREPGRDPGRGPESGLGLGHGGTRPAVRPLRQPLLCGHRDGAGRLGWWRTRLL
jgi:hypothetical protein